MMEVESLFNNATVIILFSIFLSASLPGEAIDTSGT